MAILSLAALLPAAISYTLQRWLQSQGLDETYLLDVDFNPFLGRLRLEDLKAFKVGTSPLAVRLAEIDIDWWPLTRRQASIRTLRLEGVDLALIQKDGRLSISGIPLPAAGQGDGKQPPAWGFGIDRLEIRDSRVGLQLPDFTQTLSIDRIALEGLRSWEADKPASLKLLLHIGDSSVNLDLGVRSFALTRTVDGQVRIKGLDLASLAADLKKLLPEQLAIDKARLDMDARIQLRLSGQDLSYRQQGRVSLSDGDLQYLDQRLQLGKTTWDGELGWSRSGGPAAAGRLELATLALSAPARKLKLAHLKDVRVTGLTLDGEQNLTLATLAATSPTLLSPAEANQPLFSAAGLQLDASRYREGRIELGAIAIEDARVSLLLGKDGVPAPLARLRQIGEQTPSTAPPADKAERLQIRLAGLAVGGQSQVTIHDARVSPAFDQRLELQELHVGPIDSQSAAPTPFTLAGRIGDYSDIRLSGTARPLADKLTLALDGDLRAIDLPPLSSYTARALGYDLRSGQLDAKLQLKVVDDQLDSQAELTLNKLTVKAADPVKYGQMAAELSMPLDSALNMLRDSDDNIRLKLPVTGDIHSPAFDLSNVVNKAIGKALKTAALTYVKFALQPYGALLTLAQKAGRQAEQALLKPIDFQTDSAAFGGDNIPYLGKLAQLLQDRPQMRISICGVATESDRQARIAQALATRQREPQKQTESTTATPTATLAPTVSDDQLLPLARARSEAVKRSLVELGIAPERLFLCSPELDKAPDAKPRVDLLL